MAGRGASALSGAACGGGLWGAALLRALDWAAQPRSGPEAPAAPAEGWTESCPIVEARVHTATEAVLAALERAGPGRLEALAAGASGSPLQALLHVLWSWRLAPGGGRR